METETQLRVILRPSRTNGDDDPGHVAIFWEGENGPQCRGFEFNLLDLPDAFQDASRWREYLFDHSVPGRIVDDINMLDDYMRGLPSLLERSWVSHSTPADLQTIAGPRTFGRYSFNPEDLGCHNCVTWATAMVNLCVGQVLEHVRNGRVKLLAQNLTGRREADS